MNFEKLEEFMLTGKKMAHSIYDEKKMAKQVKVKTNYIRVGVGENNKEEKKLKEKANFVFPQETDTLFWCFYILQNGYDSYIELANKNIVLEKNLKINHIENLRKNKNVIKAAKLAPLTHVENYLANESKTDIKTFFVLCLVHKINFVYLHKNTYCLMNNIESDDSALDLSLFHVLKKTDDSVKYGVFQNENYENEKNEKIKSYMNSYFHIENISKPMKAMSSYKISELVDVATKLGLVTLKNDSKNEEKKEKTKTKTKKEIYESIIQYF
jgi:hypothetical protein